MNSGSATATVCACGKLLQWKAADSFMFVCSYCRKKHYRFSNATHEHEPAMLRFDSPVKLDMSLQLNSTSYTVCGRTQWLCESQNTQVWTLVNPNLSCTNLHETWGDFFLLKESEEPVSISKFDRIHLEKELKIKDEKFYVTRIDRLNKHRTEGETGIDYDHLSNTFQVYMRSKQSNSIYMAWIHNKTSLVLYELIPCEPLEGKTEKNIRILPIHI